MKIVEWAKSWSVVSKWGLLAATIILIFDRLTKTWIVHQLELRVGESIDILPFFNLTRVANSGVSFGLFPAGSPWAIGFLFLFSMIVVAFLVRWLWQVDRLSLAIGLGLVIGGAVGNAADRLIYGAVVDFLDFSTLPFPFGFRFIWIFNIADSAVSIGVAILVYDAFFAKEEPKSSTGGAGSAE